MKKSVRQSLRNASPKKHERRILARQVKLFSYTPQKIPILTQLFYAWLICMGAGVVLSIVVYLFLHITGSK